MVYTWYSTSFLGVTHFFLYNDASDDTSIEVLEPYINSNQVTIMEYNLQWSKMNTNPEFRFSQQTDKKQFRFWNYWQG